MLKRMIEIECTSQGYRAIVDLSPKDRAKILICALTYNKYFCHFCGFVFNSPSIVQGTQFEPCCPECESPNIERRVEEFQEDEPPNKRVQSDCGYVCGYVEPYGWVPEDGCPVHDPE